MKKILFLITSIIISYVGFAQGSGTVSDPKYPIAKRNTVDTTFEFNEKQSHFMAYRLEQADIYDSIIGQYKIQMKSYEFKILEQNNVIVKDSLERNDFMRLDKNNKEIQINMGVEIDGLKSEVKKQKFLKWVGYGGAAVLGGIMIYRGATK